MSSHFDSFDLTLWLTALTPPYRFPAESRSRRLEIVFREVGFVTGQGEEFGSRRGWASSV